MLSAVCQVARVAPGPCPLERCPSQSPAVCLSRALASKALCLCHQAPLGDPGDPLSKVSLQLQALPRLEITAQAVSARSTGRLSPAALQSRACHKATSESVSRETRRGWQLARPPGPDLGVLHWREAAGAHGVPDAGLSSLHAVTGRPLPRAFQEDGRDRG